MNLLEIGLCFAEVYTCDVDPARYLNGTEKNGRKKAIPSEKLFEGFRKIHWEPLQFQNLENKKRPRSSFQPRPRIPPEQTHLFLMLTQ
jgi:hypothetical protein